MSRVAFVTVPAREAELGGGRAVRGRIDALVVVGALVVTVGGSSALAAGARPAKPPRGISASGEPMPPKRPIPRAPQERRGRTFSGQDADVATQTVDREFPGFVREKAWRDLSDSPGVRVKRYLSPQSALVDVDGKRAVVQSELPLSVETDDGAKAVDAELVDDGTRLRPRRPLARYTVGEQADTSLLSFDGSGLAVGPAGVAARTGREKGESIVHPNVARDTDLVVKATPVGAQFGWVLRSLDSPTRLRLKVTLRDGDRLATTSPDAEGPRRGPKGAAVVLRDAKAAVSISPTIAVDADGADVPVETSVDGDELIIKVTPGAARLPILVDPFVAEDQRYWVTDVNQNNPALRLDFNGWRFQQGGGAFGSHQGPSGFGNGQYLFSNPGSFYATNAVAQWIFDAPYVPGFEAEGAHIFKADFGNTVHTVSDRGSCIGEGIYNRQASEYEATGRYRGGSVFDRVFDYPPRGSALYGLPPYINCGPEGIPGQGQTYGYKVHCLSACDDGGGDPRLGSPGNLAVMTMIQGGGVPGRGGVVYQGSSLIFMSEQARPRLTGNTAPAGWTNQPFTLSSTAADYGLGVYRHSASAPGYAGRSVSGNCDGAQRREGGPPGSKNTGDRNTRCPRFGLDLNVPSSDLGDGAYDVTFNAIDVVDNPQTRNVPVKIDTKPPALSITGPLKDAENGFARAGDSAQIVANDPSSGARSLTVRLDGVAHGPTVTCAADGCSTSKSLTIDSSLTEGLHTVSVTASDLLNQTSTTSWQFRIDKTAPTVTTSGDLAGADGYTVTQDSLSLEATAEDLQGAQPASGIRRIVIDVDPRTAGDAARRVTFDNPGCVRNLCPPSQQLAPAWAYASDRYGNGDHVVEVSVEDGVGNVGGDDFAFTVTHAQQLPSQTLALGDGSELLVDGAAAGDRLGASVAAVEDINADGTEDLLVGAPGVDNAGQSDTGAAYLIYGSSDTSPVGVTGGDPRVVRLLSSTGGLNAGAAVAAGGDINGDGRFDLLVGSPGAPGLLGLTNPLQGRVWAIFGGSDLPATINLDALGSRGFEIRGPLLSGSLIPPLLSPTATSTFGNQLATRRFGEFETEGDVNGDGKDEIVIGAGNTTSPTGTSGVTYVIFGRSATSAVDLGAANGDPGAAGFRIYGSGSALSANPTQAGTHTSVLGDVNGDKLADIAVSEPGNDAGRTAAGTAYVIFGRTQTTPIALAEPLGDRGFAIRGGPGDRVATTAGPGDLNGDGIPDIAIGGHGAFVIFGRAATDTVDLAAAFDGYRMQAPTGGGFDRAVVSSAGDLDGDLLGDLNIGFSPADADRGVSYLTYGKLGTTPLDLGALRGDQGTRVDGPTAGRAGAASDGLDASGPSAQHATAIGAPDANASRGQLRSVSSARLIAAKDIDKFNCAPRTMPAFPFRGSERPSPFCRRALRGTIDIPLSGDPSKKGFNPRPKCGLYNPRTRCFPTAFSNGNARVLKPILASTTQRVPVYDSFGPPGSSPRSTAPFAYVQGVYPGCFNIYDRNMNLRGTTEPMTADPQAFPNGCDPARSSGAPADMEFQGRGCMATRNLESGYTVAGLIQAKGQPTARNTGLRGFIPLTAVPKAPGATGRGVPSGPTTIGGATSAQFRNLQDAYPGCGRKRPRQTPLPADQLGPATSELKQADNFVIQPDPAATYPFLDGYVSPGAFRDGCKAQTATNRPAGCTGFYAAYQGPCYAPDVAAVATSTTYVARGVTPRTNDRKFNPSNASSGGIARALVRRDQGPGTFLPYDRMTYADNNVADAQGAIATWVFGNANPKAAADNAARIAANSSVDTNDLEQDMFSWTPIRNPKVAVARFIC